ncbi:Hpt domain-containing protein [Fundidesulfovibrio terrae]|uniref:Hpt domain-containing protein n=1 Tax=Fundidesulfovibrio terrae TaxID=2922866 RepID=UPI001FAF641F|nr:Hpt domain-containing protein [Fundidesulfovibrio terrae]
MLEGVPDVLRPLLPEVYEALREILSQACGAVEAGDAAGARAAAHQLKGAAMRFSLEALAQKASQAEECAGSGDLSWTGAALREFTALLSLLERTGP